MNQEVTEAFNGRSDADILEIVRNIMNGGEETILNLPDDTLDGNHKFDFVEADGVKYVSLYTEQGTVLVTFKRVGDDGTILIGMYPAAVPDDTIEYHSLHNLVAGKSRKRRRRTRKTRRGRKTRRRA
jgi:hypothetical protein